MRSLRSSARSPLTLALLLLACLAQQLGAAAHGVMLVRTGMPAGMLHEVCTSAGLVRVPEAPDPAKSPRDAGGICDLCATAMMASLPAAPANGFAVAPTLRDEPAAAPVPPPASPAQRAYHSRAPPVFLSA